MLTQKQLFKQAEPLRTKADVRRLFDKMMELGHVREAHLFMINIFLGLRWSDLITMKFADFKKDKIKITEKKTEKKTGQTRKLMLDNPQLLKHVTELALWYKANHPYHQVKLLAHSTHPRAKPGAAISDKHFNNCVQSAARRLGWDYNVSTHTMRKTFAYRVWKDTGKNTSRVQKILGHRSPEHTLVYIGETERQIEETLMAISY